MIPVTNRRSNSERALVYRLLSLSFITRFHILLKLDLVDEGDEKLEHMEFLGKVLQKAKKNEKLASLWDKISQALNESDIDNPFIDKVL